MFSSSSVSSHGAWRPLLVVPLLALLGGAPAALANDAPAKSATEATKPADEPKAEQSVTQGKLPLPGGGVLDYTATAGTLIIRDNADKPIASIGYVAYTKNGVKDPATRPVTFSFNGGPGSSSMWLHMGVMGPKRLETVDAAPTPPAPYRLLDNQHGVLDRSDVVMIDPVGTGISRAVGEKKDEDFWGVDADIDSVVRFIAQYVDDNHRWNSPKFLLGESYGTTRGTAIVEQLQSRRNMLFNGLILVSVATDIGGLDDNDSDRPFLMFLPTLTATAWYHKALPGPQRELEPVLAEARAFTEGPYATALMKGAAIPPAELAAVAARMAELTGLSADYIAAAGLRVTSGMFQQELLRSKGLTVGRIDSRFLGMSRDFHAKEAEYDPQATAISGAFTAGFLDYYHRTLKFGAGKTYRTTNYMVGSKWKWEHQQPGYTQAMVNTSPDLGRALVANPSLQVLVLNGYLDLATPFYGAEWMMTHLNAPATVQQRIRMEYYVSGHMMYLHPESMVKMKRDLDAFYDATQQR
jgi:carboxypeptidase C (cathepsin A)